MQYPPPADWPNIAHSRQILCKPHRWHVQQMGPAQDAAAGLVLLLHGAGGSTHSFRDLAPILARSYQVVAIDLPGQGFTQLGARHRSGLQATAEDISALCAAQGWQPQAIIGHSAGGALALALSHSLLSPRGQPPKVIGINPALDHFKGVAGVLFPALARMLAAVPFTAQIFAASARDPRRVSSLISGTGSDIDPKGLTQYQQLISDRNHADAALLMMAQWDLQDLLQNLEAIRADTLFLCGDKDKAVPPAVSDKAAARIPGARVTHLPDLGHLAHEEAPEIVARHILAFLSET